MEITSHGDAARQPTVKEVARLAGVSPMTVSRTLAGGKNVRTEVQERVLEAVRQLGYHRNENARSIRPGQSSGLVGVAITNLGNPYYGNFALGVEEIAAHYGRRIILGNTGEDPIRERQLIADLIGRQVEGLVLVPSGANAEYLRQDLLRDTPLVLASRTVDGVDADAVVLDDVGGAYRGTTVLLEAGHRRIAYLGNVTSIFTGRRRFDGFSRALADFGLEADPELVKRGQQDVETARVAMKALLDLDDPPTAVFSANNRNTIGALKEIGVLMDADPAARLPSIVSFDDFELAEMMPVPVTIVDHDARELGREAGRMLFARLAGDGADAAPRQVEMPTHVRVVRP
jgi:LacI family transcriptional regulator